MFAWTGQRQMKIVDLAGPRKAREFEKLQVASSRLQRITAARRCLYSSLDIVTLRPLSARQIQFSSEVRSCALHVPLVAAAVSMNEFLRKLGVLYEQNSTSLAAPSSVQAKTMVRHPFPGQIQIVSNFFEQIVGH